jgi:hypothetical protein
MSYVVLFGFLVHLNRMYTDVVQRSPTKSNTDLNIMRCSQVPRFKYLPIRYSFKSLKETIDDRNLMYYHNLILNLISVLLLYHRELCTSRLYKVHPMTRLLEAYTSHFLMVRYLKVQSLMMVRLLVLQPPYSSLS